MSFMSQGWESALVLNVFFSVSLRYTYNAETKKKTSSLSGFKSHLDRVHKEEIKEKDDPMQEKFLPRLVCPAKSRELVEEEVVLVSNSSI